jgi:hypothetical protein
MFFSLIDCGHSTDCELLANGHLDSAEYKTGLFEGAINQPFFCQPFLPWSAAKDVSIGTRMTRIWRIITDNYLKRSASTRGISVIGVLLT